MFVHAALIGLIAALLPAAGLLLTDAPFAWPLSVFTITLLALFLTRSLRSRPLRTIAILFINAALFICNATFFFSYYLQNTGFNDAFFYHVRLNLMFAGVGEFSTIIAFCLLYFGTLGVLMVKHVRAPIQGRPRWIPVLLTLCLIIVSVLFWPPFTSALSYLNNRYQPLHSRFTNAGIAPSTVAAALPPAGDELWHAGTSQMQNTPAASEGPQDILARILYDLQERPYLSSPPRPGSPNIILLYLEGVEQRYFDEETFPGLLPNFKKLRSRSMVFSNMSQTPGTGWTIAGMVASQCGVPLYTPFITTVNHMAIGTSFMPGATCLGDILSSAGYRMVFIGGADTRFGDKDKFLKSHGYDEIVGRGKLTALVNDPGAINYWGIYDDVLLEQAYQKFLTLSEQDRPFGLTLLTLDTHHPDGFLSRSCTQYRDGENSMLNAVHCTDQLVSQFIEKVRSSSYSSNTAIAVMSDHLALHNVSSDLLARKKRYLTFLVNFPDDRSGDIRSPGTHFDIAPTIFHLLGLNVSGQFGLGHPLTGQPGYLYQRAGTDHPRQTVDDIVGSRPLRSYVEGLWQVQDSSLQNKPLVLNATDYSISFGDRRFIFRAQSQNKPTATLLEFDPVTLEMIRLKSYPQDLLMGPFGFSAEVLGSRGKLVVAVGSGYHLSGFIERPLPGETAFFVGKPDGTQYRAGLLSGQLSISPEEIKKLSASPERQDVFELRKKLVESLQRSEGIEKLKLLEEIKRAPKH